MFWIINTMIRNLAINQDKEFITNKQAEDYKNKLLMHYSNIFSINFFLFVLSVIKGFNKLSIKGSKNFGITET